MSGSIPDRQICRRVARASALAALGTAAMSATSHAALVSWTGAGGNNLWSNSLNWSNNSVPGANDTVTIQNTTVDLGGDRTISNLRVVGDVTLANGVVTAFNADSALNFPGPDSLQAQLTGRSALFRLSGSINGPLSFGGEFVGTGFIAIANTVTFSTANPFAGDVYLTNATLKQNAAFPAGRLVSVDATLDNRETPLSNRLNPANFFPLSLDVGANPIVRLIGHATTPVSQSITSVDAPYSVVTFASESTGADAVIDIGSFTRGPRSTFYVDANPASGGRVVTGTPQVQFGGTGGTQTPVIPGAVAVVVDSDVAANVYRTAGFLTYDTSLNLAGNVQGFRKVRDDEFVTSPATSGPLDNLRIVGAQSLSANAAANALALRENTSLDLANSDLSLNSGGILNDALAANDADLAPAISASGSGRLKSARQLFVITSDSATRARPLTISAPIEAPGLLAIGRGRLRLSGASFLADGITVQGAVVSFASQAALGGGPLTLVRGEVAFDGSQTITTPVLLASGGESAWSAVNVRTAPGEITTIAAPVDGFGGIVATGGGTLRLLNGGAMSGGIDTQQNSRAILAGSFTSTAARGIHGTGNIFASGVMPLRMEYGSLSAGAPGEVGQVTIKSFEGSIAGSLTLVVDIDGTAADAVTVLERNLPSFSNLYLLSVDVNQPPVPLQKYTILSNTFSGATNVRFENLFEGSTFTADGYQFRISYAGGDGNEVTLTVLPEPASAGLAVGLACLALNHRPRRDATQTKSR